MQIRCFLAVSKHLNFTKAASELFISQSAISRHIALLEKDLGVSLFVRSNRCVQLTQAGEWFHEIFEEFSDRISETIKRAKELDALQGGRVKLGCIEGWNASAFFPRLAAKLSLNYPQMEITLESHNFSTLKTLLKNNQLDAILTLDDMTKGLSGVDSIPVARLPVILLYSVLHPLASKPHLTALDFKDAEFFVVSTEETGHASMFVQRCCADYGFKPRIRTVPNSMSVFSYVQSGFGVAIADSWNRECYNAQCRYIELNCQQLVSLVWRKSNPNPALPVLLHQIQMLFA